MRPRQGGPPAGASAGQGPPTPGSRLVAPELGEPLWFAAPSLSSAVTAPGTPCSADQGHEGTVSRAAHLATGSWVWALLCQARAPAWFPHLWREVWGGAGGRARGSGHAPGDTCVASPPVRPCPGLRTGWCPVPAAEQGYQYQCPPAAALLLSQLPTAQRLPASPTAALTAAPYPTKALAPIPQHRGLRTAGHSPGSPFPPVPSPHNPCLWPLVRLSRRPRACVGGSLCCPCMRGLEQAPGERLFREGPIRTQIPGDEEAGGADKERADGLHPKANSCAPRNTSKAVGGDPRDGRRQIARLLGSQYPGFPKNAYSPNTKTQTA